MFVQEPRGVIERAVDRRVYVLGPVPPVGAAIGDELRARNGEIDAQAIVAPLMLVAMRRLDGHAAGDDALVERAQLFGMPTDTGFESVGALDVAKGDAQGEGPHRSHFLEGDKRAHGPLHDGRRFSA
jgi:hypothetical protein